ncbi:hypothetical protein [Nocardia altamirensis]|uniref:hypothetical protein n=1 Tax=Nocardia altamirensis TaxID=472158 RepID=UPI003F76BF49
MKFVRRLALWVTALVMVGLAAAGAAAAETAVPFQINAAPFGNPNGSFDSKATDCAVIVGEQPGRVVVTGAAPGRWGCSPYAAVRWVNLTTGATGAATMSDGLFGFPAAATLPTGRGQVALILTVGGITTPGFATFSVP